MQVIDAMPHQERPALPEPSYPAQILTVAARILTMEPPHWTLDTHTLNAAMHTAGRAVLATLPESVQQEARSRTRAALPAIAGQSRGQYAERLRYTARGL